MKKLFLLLMAVLIVGCAGYITASNAKYSTKQIDDEHIYFFEQKGCPHCIHAKEYVSKKYPNLKVKYLDISQKENQAGFVACADKFGLDRKSLGTPLICMGQNFILGWSDDEQYEFDMYVKAFVKNK